MGFSPNLVVASLAEGITWDGVKHPAPCQQQPARPRPPSHIPGEFQGGAGSEVGSCSTHQGPVSTPHFQVQLVMANETR